MIGTREEAALKPVLGSLRNALIIEGGAHDGATCEWILAKLPNLPQLYLCVEPDPRNLSVLSSRRFPSCVKIIPVALARQNGNAGLNLSDMPGQPEGWTCSSTIRKPTGHLKRFPSITFFQTVPVKTQTLQSLCGDHQVKMIDFLWLDIEGAERDVIEGSPGIISCTKFMWLEAWREELYEGMWTRADLLEYLKQQNWELMGEFEQDVLVRNRAYA